jgi:hypothetical protein
MSENELLYQQARRLVDDEMRRHAYLSTHDLFRKCWTVVEAHEEKFRGRAALSQLNDKAWRVMVYHDLSKYFLRIRPDFTPQVRSLDLGFKTAVIASIHTGLELGIAKAFLERNKKLSIIHLPSSQNRERGELFKLPSHVQYIKADANCLLNARRALSEGRCILADCDHPLPENPRANVVRAISSAIFELAKRTGADLCFVLPYVDKYGVIAFRAEMAASPPQAQVDYRERFVDFLNRSGLDWIQWKNSGS